MIMMETTRIACACKGIRTCLLCEEDKQQNKIVKNINNNNRIQVDEEEKSQLSKQYRYCMQCGDCAILERLFDAHQAIVHHNGDCEQKINDEYDGDNGDNCVEKSIPIDGVFVQTDIITEAEEQQLIDLMDHNYVWINSQSGRRKQDFGPKINFKKQKINFNSFVGLPRVVMQLLDCIQSDRLRVDKNWQRFVHQQQQQQNDNESIHQYNGHNILHNFHTVEVCHLEYCPSRGSSIDPHFDDFWIWGERLVTLNLLSQTTLTLTLPAQTTATPATTTTITDDNSYCINISLSPRSIVVLYGEARYRYHHSICRSAITSRRVAITFRELPLKFLSNIDEDNGNDNNDEDTSTHQQIGKEFLKRSQKRI